MLWKKDLVIFFNKLIPWKFIQNYKQIFSFFTFWQFFVYAIIYTILNLKKY